jgi:transmembrane 9 superfamily protein 1
MTCFALCACVAFSQEELAEEETGWKMIHGDVFRNPDHLNLFAAFIGSGAQIFCTIFILLLSVVLGVFKATRRGALLTAAILIYALCGLFGGLVGGRLYRQLKGQNWAWNTMLTASIFPVPLAIVFTFVNTVAWNSNSTAALPFTTIAVSVHRLAFPLFFVSTLY